MMKNLNRNEFIELVFKPGADIELLIESFTEKVINDEQFRQLVIDLLLEHDHIMVYYHSYLIIDAASKREPILFYSLWDRFVLLLNHKNSYHRNYGMQLLANLTKVDIQNKLELIIDIYYKQLDDQKFLTRRYCVLNSREIIKNKPYLSDLIIYRLMNFIRTTDNSEKQQNLIISDFINVVSEIVQLIKNKNDLLDFFLMIENQVRSNKVKKQILKVIPIIKK
jgi:hypothetical protein